MAVWVVVLEAVVDPKSEFGAQTESDSGFDEDDLDALADALAQNYPVVAGTGRSYETELWVEGTMASNALLDAERLVQAAAREVGLATTEIVRAEVRSAKAIEDGLIGWGAPPGQSQAEREKAAAKEARAKKAGTKKGAKTAPAKKATKGPSGPTERGRRKAASAKKATRRRT